MHGNPTPLSANDQERGVDVHVFVEGNKVFDG